jgi:hypothetical protein
MKTTKSYNYLFLLFPLLLVGFSILFILFILFTILSLPKTTKQVEDADADADADEYEDKVEGFTGLRSMYHKTNRNISGFIKNVTDGVKEYASRFARKTGISHILS